MARHDAAAPRACDVALRGRRREQNPDYQRRSPHVLLDVDDDVIESAHRSFDRQRHRGFAIASAFTVFTSRLRRRIA